MTAVVRSAIAILAATILVAVHVEPAHAQNPSLRELLPRLGASIQKFITDFSNVVAEETYKQEISSPRRKRQLKSDLMLVKYPGAEGWLMFRDTFEVDGKSVRNGPERLMKLFGLLTN